MRQTELYEVLAHPLIRNNLCELAVQRYCPFDREGFLAIIFDNCEPGLKHLAVDLLHVLVERALIFDLFQDVATLLGAITEHLRLFVLLLQCCHVVDL